MGEGRKRYIATNCEHNSQQQRGNSSSSATTVNCPQSHCDDSFTEGILHSKLPGAHSWDCIQGWRFRQDWPGQAHKVALLLKAWLLSVRSGLHTGRWAWDTTTFETTLQELLIWWKAARGWGASPKAKQHYQTNQVLVSLGGIGGKKTQIDHYLQMIV